MYHIFDRFSTCLSGILPIGVIYRKFIESMLLKKKKESDIFCKKIVYIPNEIEMDIRTIKFVI